MVQLVPLTRWDKVDAKVANERTKLLASLLNGLAGAVIVGGIVTPIVVTGKVGPLDLVWGALALGSAAVVHLVARLVLHDLVPEE